MLRVLSRLLAHRMNQGHYGAALSRFLRWQLSIRLLPVPHVVPFVDDTVLVMERGMTGATGNWYNGLHEHRDMAFVLHLLREDDLFVDVGANVGSYTVLASGSVKARTVGIEPVPEIFAKLRRNVLVNDMAGRVTCHNIGLGAREELLRFTAHRDTTNHVAAEGSDAEGTIVVPVRCLDKVLEGQAPRLVKIDVEGWEAEVLAGATDTLANPKLAAVIIETNQNAERYANAGGERVTEIMLENGFQAYSYDPFGRELIQGGTDHNTIFIRDVAFVRERIGSARTHRLVNGQI